MSNTLFITESQANDIMENNNKDFRLIDEGEWEDDGKYQYRDVIFEYLAREGEYYRFTQSRSGSYFSDYEYELLDLDYGDSDNPQLKCCQVIQKTKTIQVWEAI